MVLTPNWPISQPKLLFCRERPIIRIYLKSIVLSAELLTRGKSNSTNISILRGEKKTNFPLLVLQFQNTVSLGNKKVARKDI